MTETIQIRQHPDGLYFWTEFDNDGGFVAQSDPKYKTIAGAKSGAKSEVGDPVKWDTIDAPPETADAA